VRLLFKKNAGNRTNAGYVQYLIRHALIINDEDARDERVMTSELSEGFNEDKLLRSLEYSIRSQRKPYNMMALSSEMYIYFGVCIVHVDK